MNDEPRHLIITGRFNGLLDRLAQIDFFSVWVSGSRILKKAKKDRVEATMGMSEVSQLTGLTKEDIEFFVSLRLIECAEAGDDSLLPFKDVFCLVRIVERFVAVGIISQSGGAVLL